MPGGQHRILVYGAGVIGSYYATLFAAAGEDVSLLARGRRLGQKLDFPDGAFDAVTSNYVYHNFPSRDRQAILLETLRVLKKGGNSSCPRGRPGGWPCQGRLCWLGRNECSFALSRCRALVTEAGEIPSRMACSDTENCRCERI